MREAHDLDRPGPSGPRGLERPAEAMPIPDNFDWDLFIGPAPPLRPAYHEIYTPWNWRGFWDFGTGAFGDMACHIMGPRVPGPSSSSTPRGFPVALPPLIRRAPPQAEKVRFDFPEREAMDNVAMPAVQVHWYDGGFLPDRPEGMADGKPFIQDGLGGLYAGWARRIP